jgi:hypothetical protein
MIQPFDRRMATRHLSSGQSAIEVVLVLALVGLVFVMAPGSPLAQLASAFDTHYQRYTWALSQP